MSPSERRLSGVTVRVVHSATPEYRPRAEARSAAPPPEDAPGAGAGASPETGSELAPKPSDA